MAAKLNAAIAAVNLVENLLDGISPPQLALRAVSALLTKLRVRFIFLDGILQVTLI